MSGQSIVHFLTTNSSKGVFTQGSTGHQDPNIGFIVTPTLIGGNHKFVFMPTLDQKLLSATSKWNCQSWTWTPSSRRWNPKPGLLYILEDPLNSRAPGIRQWQQQDAFHWGPDHNSGEHRAPLILVLKTPQRHFESTSVDAKNSAETMSTEGRFNSSLSKSSGWSWETNTGTHSSGGQWRGWTFPASSTWSPTRAENPSLWQSASSCSFMVVSGAIIIVVEPWKNMLCWSQVCEERKLPNGRSWLAISMGSVLPMPVGRQERMWCLSSLSTTAAVMSACDCHILDAILSATKSKDITWKSCKLGGSAGWSCCNRA